MAIGPATRRPTVFGGTLKIKRMRKFATRLAVVAMLASTVMGAQVASARAASAPQVPPACSNPTVAEYCDRLSDLLSEIASLPDTDPYVETVSRLADRIETVVLNFTDQCLNDPGFTCQQLKQATLTLVSSSVDLALACANRSYQLCDSAMTLAEGLVDTAVALALQCARGQNQTCNEAESTAQLIVDSVVEFIQTCLGGTNATCETAKALGVQAAGLALEEAAAVELLAVNTISNLPSAVQVETLVLDTVQLAGQLITEAVGGVGDPNDLVGAANALVGTVVGTVGSAPADVLGLAELITDIAQEAAQAGSVPPAATCCGVGPSTAVPTVLPGVPDAAAIAAKNIQAAQDLHNHLLMAPVGVTAATPEDYEAGAGSPCPAGECSTAPASYAISVSGTSQLQHNWCVPATGQIILASMGKSVTQYTLSKEMGTGEDGTGTLPQHMPASLNKRQSRNYFQYYVPSNSADIISKAITDTYRTKSNFGLTIQMASSGYYPAGTPGVHEVDVYGYWTQKAGGVYVWDPFNSQNWPNDYQGFPNRYGKRKIDAAHLGATNADSGYGIVW